MEANPSCTAQRSVPSSAASNGTANIGSIGPNLNLAPDADPGDGEFDVVMITETQRMALADYVRQKIRGREVLFDFPVLKAKDLAIYWDGRHVHVDDEYHKLEEPARIKIEMREGLLEFLLPVIA